MIMLDIFHQKRTFVKIVLWFLVIVTAVSLISWFASPGSVPDTQKQSASEQQTTQSQTEQLQTLLKQYQQQETKKPNDVTVLTEYARVANLLARDYIQSGKTDQAAGLFRQAAARYEKALAQKDDSTLRLELGGVYYYLQEFDKASARQS